MSAHEDGNNSESSKRRRACDLCRRSKVRCNPPATQDTPCAHCAQSNIKCTFLEDSKKRTAPKGYILSLENRCMQLERLVRRIAPGLDIDAEVGPAFTQDTWSSKRAFNHQPRSAPPTLSSVTSTAASTTAHINTPKTEPVSTFDWDITAQITAELEGLDLSHAAIGGHFIGTSSGVEMIQTAFHVKASDGRKPNFADEKVVQSSGSYLSNPEWKVKLFAKPSIALITWPPEDLQEQLLSLYFEKGALMLPIIHRPSFQENFDGGLHKREPDFAGLALLVFSLGSRFCTDTRVCAKDSEGKADPTSAGWPYFMQVCPLLLSPGGLSGTHSLPQLQSFALSALYLQHIAALNIAWLFSGIGVRVALDLGLHTERVYASDHPLKSEAWRRTFWALISFDTLACERLGRPCAVSLAEVGAALPLEVDDEYYDPVTRQWKQPASQPSKTSSLVQFVKLQKVVLRIGHTASDAQNQGLCSAAELDDMLGSWHDQLPKHLRWDPNTRDPIFLQQAGVLQLFFLYAKITVHRRLLSVRFRQPLPSATFMPAMTICTNAARSTVHVIESLIQAGHWPFPFSPFAFGAALIILFDMWDMERKDPSSNAILPSMELVQRCLSILRASEQRWQSGARLLVMLEELASKSEAIPSGVSHAPPRKRGREYEDGDNTDQGPRPFRHHPLSTSARPSNPLSSHMLPPENAAFVTPVPDAPDIGAIQWDASLLEGFAPFVEHDPLLNIPGPSDAHEGFPGLGGYLPDNTFQTLFGGHYNIYGGAAVQPLAGGTTYGGPYGINNDWSTYDTNFGHYFGQQGGSEIP